MLIALIVSRLVLFIVFATAGFAKLSDPTGSRKAIIGFGAPTWLATPLGVLLPLVELTVAAILVPVGSAWLGAVGALSLLLAFIIGISINLARGRTPDCHCFGQLHSAPAGWSTLARNAVLASAAGFLVWQGRHNPFSKLRRLACRPDDCSACRFAWRHFRSRPLCGPSGTSAANNEAAGANSGAARLAGGAP